MTDIVFTEAGRTRKGEEAQCKSCLTPFIRRKSHSNGKKLYCSLKCSSLASRKRVKVECATCGSSLERTPGRVAVTISGLSFCNAACHASAQCLDGGLTEVHPSHYGNGSSRYQQVAFRNHKKECVDCALAFPPLLVVHHIDGDRTNADPANLEIVCHNHHAVRHMRMENGVWKYSSSSLTPRDKLGEVAELFKLSGDVVQREDGTMAWFK